MDKNHIRINKLQAIIAVLVLILLVLSYYTYQTKKDSNDKITSFEAQMKFELNEILDQKNKLIEKNRTLTDQLRTITLELENSKSYQAINQAYIDLEYKELITKKSNGPFRINNVDGSVFLTGNLSKGEPCGIWTYHYGSQIIKYQYIEQRIGAICNDGSRSSATGRGACSWHGGVNHWITQFKKVRI